VHFQRKVNFSPLGTERIGEWENWRRRRRGRDGQGIADRKGSQNETAPTNYPTHNHSAINCSGPENTSERVRKGIGIGMGMGVGVGSREEAVPPKALYMPR